MKREAPTERDITDLIASAYEAMPAPDARCLAEIEQRLLEATHSRDRSKIVWWWLLAGALVAGAASALWWAVDYDSGKGRETPVPALTSPPIVPAEADKPAAPGKSEITESNSAGETTQKNGPVIYRK